MTDFVTGVHDGMPAADYHAVEALSSSGIRKLLQSPLHYRLYRDRPSEPTAAMLFGTAVHCGVLEPDTFADRVVCAPDVNKRTNAGRDLLAAFERDNAGRVILSPDDYARACTTVAAVRAHAAARKLLDGAEVEKSIFWIDGGYKVPCKARFDAWQGGIVVDLKTTTDASPDEFAKSIANFYYHAQAAMYCSGAEHALNRSPDAFVFVVVESLPPHAVACYQLPNAAILAGMHLVNRAQARYAEVLASGQWTGYPETIEVIQLPRYAMRFAV